MLNDNMNILITGGTRGIGKSIAEKFAEYKANIIIFDIIDTGFDEVKKTIEEKNSNVEFYKVDVSNYKNVKETMDIVLDKYGSIDVLVNNAGITKDNLLMGMSEDEWDKVIAVNLKGTFNCSQTLIKSMIKKRKGIIINIASVIGLMGNKGQANYAASKAGIIGLTKSLAKEVGQRNVRVNAIAPGFIKTEMTEKLPEEIIKEYSKIIPLKRMGLPEDIANTCIFLASNYSSYITGQVIQVDGGMLM